MTAAKAAILQGFSERWLDVRGVRVRYFVGGAGPPVVLLHGLTGAASNFAELAPILAERPRLLMRAPDAVRGVVLAGAAGIASTTRWAEFWITAFGYLKLGRKLAPHQDRFARGSRLRYIPFGYWGASDPP